MSENQTPSRWSEVHAFCAALREVMIVAAIVLLLLAPGSVRSLLERAGVRSVAGVEFDATTLAEAQQELDFAREQMNELRTQLVMAQSRMEAEQNSNTVASLPNLGSLAAPNATQNKAHAMYSSVSKILNESVRLAENTEQSMKRSSQLHNRVLTRPVLKSPEELFGSSHAPSNSDQNDQAALPP